MIINILDRRTRPFRWKTINAIIEDAWHDNSVNDADQAEKIDTCSYDERNHITVQEAIVWAQEHPAQVTLFLYNNGTLEELLVDQGKESEVEWGPPVGNELAEFEQQMSVAIKVMKRRRNALRELAKR